VKGGKLTFEKEVHTMTKQQIKKADSDGGTQLPQEQESL